MKKASTVYWTTRDGRQLKPSQMETSHLLNILRYVRRRMRYRMKLEAKDCFSNALDALSYASGAPDGAAMAAEEAADKFMVDGAAWEAATRDPKAQLKMGLKTRIVKRIYVEARRRGVPEASILG